MNTDPLLTVVTVVRNNAAGLRATLDSLMQQRRGAWSHLVIDGASTDETTALLQDLPDWSTCASEEDEGIFDAMNKAIGLIPSGLVTFLNAGDRLARPNVLVDVLDSHARLQWRWAYGRALVVDIDGRPVRRPVGMRPYSRLRHRYGLSTICHQAVFMERGLLTEMGGFDLRFGTAADYHLLLRAGSVSPPHLLGTDDVLYLSGGVSEQQVEQHLRRRHRARADIAKANALLTTVDDLYTTGQVALVRARRVAKRSLIRLGFAPTIEQAASRSWTT